MVEEGWNCKDLLNMDTEVDLLSAPVRSNAVADYVLLLFIYLFILFFLIHRSFSETARPIITKFSGIVYSGVV